jgi:hypothetical protein
MRHHYVARQLAIAEQNLKNVTGGREAQMERLEHGLRRLRYLIFGQWVMIALWILANHFWK